ncbi:MAG: hypothetical protein J5J06_13355 [Phycisphaerae bacterium]|nr:hypothetical protein [Phycisphaerae bacterium]
MSASIDRGYLLVGAPIQYASGSLYSGVGRNTTGQVLHPTPLCPEVYKVWTREAERHVQEDDWHLFLGRHEEAVSFQDEYARLGHQFWILDVRDCQSEAAAGNEAIRKGFLGFDVANKQLYSGIRNLLMWEMPDDAADCEATIRLVQRHFRPCTNIHGLFSSVGDAQLFRDVVMELEKNVPEAMKPPFYDLRVYSVVDVASTVER